MADRIAAICGGDVVSKTLGGKTLAVLGLTFKPNTDDMRESPALAIMPALREAGALVRAFDPEGLQEARRLMPELEYCGDAYTAMEGADALILITEWNAFRALDLARVKSLLRRPVVIDLRNIYRPDEMLAAGLVYHSIGRAAINDGDAEPIAANPAALRVIA